MKASIITLASAKGGSGKTTVTAAFGTLLAAMGKRVLMIDTDAATNGLSLFYINHIVAESANKASPDLGLFEGVNISQPRRIVEIAENLYLLPATYRFQNTDAIPTTAYSQSLSSTVSHYRPKFDFILLDAQAGSDSYAEVAISREISDQVVIVSEYDPVSAAGVERLKALFSDSLNYGRTWILLNKVLPEFARSFSDFLEIAKYLNPLPWTAEVVRAFARRAVAVDVHDGNEYTFAVVQALRALLDEATRRDLEIWLEHRVVELKAPVRRQLEEAKSELELLRARRSKVRRLREAERLVVQAGALIVGGAVYLILRFVLSNPDSVVISLGVIVGLTYVASTASRLLALSRPTVAKSDLDSDIEHAESRVRRLTELADLEVEGASRRGLGPSAAV